MRITIRKIAEVAGVSRGTVDRALNGRPGVNPKVATRIREIAAQMGYKPNLAAKMLSDHKYTKKKIGIIVVTVQNPFFDEVIAGAQCALEEFEEFGITNIVKTICSYDANLQVMAIKEMVEAGVNGIVLTPINSPEVQEAINNYNKKGIKFVTINIDIGDTARIAYVGCQPRKSGVVLAGFLKLIANGNPMDVGVITNTPKSLGVTERLTGFLDTLEKECENVSIFAVYENEDDDDISYEITKKMLQEYETLNAICILGAGIIGSIKAIKELRKSKDLIVTVFDLIEEVKRGLLDDTVTITITQEPFRQGFEGVQILGKYLAYGQQPAKVLNYTDLAIITKYCISDSD